MAGSTTVLAVGGNALLSDEGTATLAAQRRAVGEMSGVVGQLIDASRRVVLTHGNGPQIGNLAYQQEDAAAVIAPQPLPMLGAMTQGQIGHQFVLGLQAQHEAISATAIVSHVVVDRDDPAFQRPTKPIGPFFSQADARRLAHERDWEIVPDAGRGYRRVVASPEPLRVIEGHAICQLVDAEQVVIAAGGGGVPVVEDDHGDLAGVDAVIDKDLTAARMATDIGAETLVLITGVPRVVLDYGTDAQRPVDELDLDEAEAHLRAGQFPAGSMGPKILAATRFIRAGGRLSVITDTQHTVAAVQGHHGTRIANKAAITRSGAP
jgi:carbamate kinase